MDVYVYGVYFFDVDGGVVVVCLDVVEEVWVDKYVDFFGFGVGGGDGVEGGLLVGIVWWWGEGGEVWEGWGYDVGVYVYFEEFWGWVDCWCCWGDWGVWGGGYGGGGGVGVVVVVLDWWCYDDYVWWWYLMVLMLVIVMWI